MYSKLCILTYHAMMNYDNHTISWQVDACYVPFFLFESASCDSLAFAESTKKGVLTCQSRLVTSYRMFDVLAWS